MPVTSTRAPRCNTVTTEEPIDDPDRAFNPVVVRYVPATDEPLEEPLEEPPLEEPLSEEPLSEEPPETRSKKLGPTYNVRPP